MNRTTTDGPQFEIGQVTTGLSILKVWGGQGKFSQFVVSVIGIKMLEYLAPTTQHRHTIMAEVTVGCPYFSDKEWSQKP